MLLISPLSPYAETATSCDVNESAHDNESIVEAAMISVQVPEILKAARGEFGYKDPSLCSFTTPLDKMCSP